MRWVTMNHLKTDLGERLFMAQTCQPPDIANSKFQWPAVQTWQLPVDTRQILHPGSIAYTAMHLYWLLLRLL